MLITMEPKEKEILESISIPPRPQALISILKESKNEDPSFPIISQAIAEDVSIASALLKVVNSVAFRRGQAVSSIDQALSLLGLRRVFAVVNTVALRNAAPAGLDLDEFWATASNVAISNSIICDVLGFKNLRDDAYTLGLFHGAGVPIMMSCFDMYDDFYTMGQKEGWLTTIEMEKAHFNTNHTTIAALLSQDWCLSDSITEAIYNLHYCEGIFSDSNISDDVLKLIAVLKMSRGFVNTFMHSCSSNEWNFIEGQVMDFLQLSETAIDEMKMTVLKRLREHDQEQEV